MNMIAPSDTVKKSAGFLALEAGRPAASLEHIATVYGELLCWCADNIPGIEDGIEFKTVAGFLCRSMLKTKEPKVLKRIGANILLIIHERGYRVGDIESDCDVRPGVLAKIKNGQPIDLDSTTLIQLAVRLAVPLELFVADYDNNPEGLRVAMESIPPPNLGEDDDDAVLTSTEQAVATKLIFPDKGVLAALPEPAGEVVTTVQKEERVTQTPSTTSSVAGVDKNVTAAVIASNVRAAAKRAEVTLTDLLAAIGVENRRHIENIEKGDGAFTTDQLTVIATKLGVDASVFLTGEGLEKFHKRQKTDAAGNALVPVGAKKLVLPPISAGQRSDYFESRCLHDNVEVVEGRKIGELLAAARSREPVDWYMLWLTVTAEGAAYQKKIDSVLALTKPWGEVMRADFIARLHEALWPSEAK